jgi:hypothetical protein
MDASHSLTHNGNNQGRGISKESSMNMPRLAHFAAWIMLVLFTCNGVRAESAKVPPLPIGVSSLGAIECDGYAYIYGGHVGKTHAYSSREVIGTFHRFKLDGGTAWEPLPEGPILQGLNLATHQGKIYRVGGMRPRNAPGSPTDNVSVVDAARFDPKSGRWEALPPMPAARSSHEVVVVGDTLVVTAGWQMRGKGTKPYWHDTTLLMDLSAKEPDWRHVPQPFLRRALTAATIGTKVYVIGGMDDEGEILQRVDIFDLATEKWTAGPPLPGQKIGFSPAAATAGGKLIVSTSDGLIHRLSAYGQSWEKAGTTISKRIVHRIIPLGDSILMLGGTVVGQGPNFADVERAPVAKPQGNPAGR